MEVLEITHTNLKESQKKVRAHRLRNKGKWAQYNIKVGDDLHRLKCFDTSIQIHEGPKGFYPGGWDMSVRDFNEYIKDKVLCTNV